VWQKLSDQIYLQETRQQKAVYFGEKIFVYAASSSSNFLYTSTDAAAWTDESSRLGGLPAADKINLSAIVEYHENLYLIDSENNIYTSANGYDWTGSSLQSADATFNSLVGVYRDRLWAILKTSAGTYCFANSTDGQNWAPGENLSENFPVSDFAAIALNSASNLPKILIHGGFSAAGDTLRNTWSSENGNYWVDFGKEKNNKLGVSAGASIIKYNDRFFLFGGSFGRETSNPQPIIESLNDGLSWGIPDSTYNCIMKTTVAGNDTSYVKYDYRSSPSVLYVVKSTGQDTSQHLIYLIGGKKDTQILSDVWVGQLNKMSFKRQ
jgi:hypothetical protein